MIIECEACSSKFNLDEHLLEPEGSKVRCTVCKHVFTAYPEEPEPDQALDGELEETVALDSPPVFDEQESESAEEEAEFGIDQTFEDAVDEDDTGETVSDAGPEANGREDVDLDEAMDQAMDDAAGIEEDVVRDEDENRIGEESDDDEGEVVTAPATKKSGRSRLLLIILIIIVLIFAGAVAVLFLSPGLIPDALSPIVKTQKTGTTDKGVRRLSFRAVNGSFIKTSGGGDRFIIKGSVSNTYSGSRSYILIRGWILDNQGKTVTSKSVYAGNTFTEEQLKETSMEEINQGLKNRSGQEGGNVNVGSGVSVPFMIVFENLPDNLSEFSVEAVSSQKGE